MSVGDRVQYIGAFWYMHTGHYGFVAEIVSDDMVRVSLDCGRYIPASQQNLRCVSPLEQLAEMADDNG